MLQFLFLVYRYTVFLFCGCIASDVQILTVFVNEAVNINCTNNTVINIKDIGVENNYNECSNRYCQLRGNETSTIENSCNNKTSCVLALDFLDSCFEIYGYFNISYTCAIIVEACSFDNGLCGWRISVDSDDSGNFNWTLGKGTLLPTATGPDKDHTISNSTGSFIYSKSHYGAKVKDRTYITSPVIYPSVTLCLSFWYHMYGDDIFALTVYKNKSNKLTPLWRTVSNKGNGWLYQMITLDDIGPYQVVFRARRGDGNKSEIAVDDIIIANKQCPASVHDCNFETDMCLWSTGSGQNEWIRNSGRTTISNTGPSIDHSLGKGKGSYIYMKAYSLRNKDAIYLNSSFIMPSRNSCFTFWYHMYGEDMGALKVYISTEESTELVWSEYGNKGARWLFASFDISVTQKYKIIIKGIKGGWKSDMAIDDIVVLSSSCSDFNRSLTTLEVGNGFINNSQTCVNPNQQIKLQECSTDYLLREHLKFDFDPNVRECSDIYTNISKSTSNFCSGPDKPDICPVTISNSLQKRPECFLAHRLILQYACEENISDYNAISQQMPNLSDVSILGIISGVVVGILLLIGVLVIIVFFRRRFEKEEKKKRITEDINNEMKDYTGIQNMSLPVSDKQPSLHSQLKETQRVTYEDQYYNLTVGGPSSNENVNIKSNGIKNQNDTKYANIDKGAPKNYKSTTVANSESAQNYIILDPKETGFNRSNELFENSTKYRLNGLAEKSGENSLTHDLDPYVTTEDEAYDSTGVIRHKETDNTLYSHSVDNVYDSASQTVKNNESFDTYDHFIGEKTEDNYDQTR